MLPPALENTFRSVPSSLASGSLEPQATAKIVGTFAATEPKNCHSPGLQQPELPHIVFGKLDVWIKSWEMDVDGSLTARMLFPK